jgi:hypothetical protein
VDSQDLARQGYRQELDRTLGSFSAFAAGFSYLSILTGMFQNHLPGTKNATPRPVRTLRPINRRTCFPKRTICTVFTAILFPFSSAQRIKESRLMAFAAAPVKEERLIGWNAA